MMTVREDTCPDRSEISVVVQVTVVDKEEISSAMVSIISDVGSWFTKVIRSVFLVMTEEQVVADALDDAVELASLLVVVLAFSRAATFLVKALAFWSRLALLSLQDCIALITSSSYFLHLLKAVLHFDNALVTATDSSSKLHPFTATREAARLVSNQQEQAAAPLFPMHLVTCAL